jgi:hypothetical protein
MVLIALVRVQPLRDARYPRGLATISMQIATDFEGRFGSSMLI